MTPPVAERRSQLQQQRQRLVDIGQLNADWTCAGPFGHRVSGGGGFLRRHGRECQAVLRRVEYTIFI